MTKRDNAYYARRLQQDRPDLWRNVVDGVMTLAEARRAAGFGGKRTRLHEMKNAWSKATDEQRNAFLEFLDAEGFTLPLPRPTPAPAPAPAPVPTSLSVPALPPAPTSKPTSTAGRSTSAPSATVGFTLARDGYLTPEAKDRINQIIDQRGLRGRHGELKVGIIMKELHPPCSPRNASLSSALSRGTRLTKDMIEALERWVNAHPPG